VRASFALVAEVSSADNEKLTELALLVVLESLEVVAVLAGAMLAPTPAVAATLRLLTALSSALMFTWYSVGTASSHAGGVMAVNADSMTDAGLPVVDSTDV
jgi:hypothetical protein